MSESVRVADYVFSFIAKQGIRNVFLVPGGGSMFLVDGLAQNADLQFVPNHHEQASSIAAEAYAHVTGKPGVAVVTTGPGATNAITGVAGAWLESVPVLIISGQVKRSDLTGDTGVRQKGPQEIDIVPMVRSITKYAVTVMDPMEIRFHLEKAYHLATSGRGGPVWIDIPLDVQASRIDPDLLVGFAADPVVATATGSLAAQVRAVIELLNTSERPILLGGHGVRLARAADDFRTLYERLHIPVGVTWPALDLIPSSHPLSIGKPGAVAQRSSNFAIQNSDLIVSVGARLDNSVTAFNAANFGRNARRAIVDVDPAELAKFNMPIEVSIEADAGEFIRSLLEQIDLVKTVDRAGWHKRCTDWKHRYPLADAGTFPSRGMISHYHVTHVLSEEIPEDTLVVTGSSGLAIEFFFTGFQSKRGQRVMNAAAALGAMGFGLPAIVGAGVAYGKSFVGIESDGSSMFNLQELLTIRAMDIPVRLFILNNGGYASIRNTQRNYFDGRYVGTGPEAGLLLADVVAFAETIGIPGVRISDASELAEKVRYALRQPGPFICDIELEPNEALWPKSAAIPMPDGSMTSMPLEDMSPLLSRAELRENMLGPLDPASEHVPDPVSP